MDAFHECAWEERREEVRNSVGELECMVYYNEFTLDVSLHGLWHVEPGIVPAGNTNVQWLARESRE